MEKIMSFAGKRQLTFRPEMSKIMLIHYATPKGGASVCCKENKYYILGGNKIEGLGIYYIRRGDGSCHQFSAGNRAEGWC
jgi:hypothetical protein